MVRSIYSEYEAVSPRPMAAQYVIVARVRRLKGRGHFLDHWSGLQVRSG